MWKSSKRVNTSLLPTVTNPSNSRGLKLTQVIATKYSFSGYISEHFPAKDVCMLIGGTWSLAESVFIKGQAHLLSICSGYIMFSGSFVRRKLEKAKSNSQQSVFLQFAFSGWIQISSALALPLFCFTGLFLPRFLSDGITTQLVKTPHLTPACFCLQRKHALP